MWYYVRRNVGGDLLHEDQLATTAKPDRPAVQEDAQPTISASVWLRGIVGLAGLTVALRMVGDMQAVVIVSFALSFWSLLFILSQQARWPEEDGHCDNPRTIFTA